MKILILTNNDVGLFKFRKELIKRLLDNHNVYICLPNGDFIPVLEKIGCKFIPCEFERHGMNPLSEIKLIKNYWRVIREVKPNFVFTYTIKPNSYGGAVCALLKVPYIANVTGLGNSIENGGVLQKVTLVLYKYGLRKAQRVFFQNTSNYQFMSARGIVRDNYSILPGSGVNLEEHSYESYPSEKDGIRFLFVGRIMKDKGIEEFLQCAKQIHEIHPECSFSIVGDYDDEFYRSIIEKYEKEGILKFFGQQKDVHSFMKLHHILIQPSYHEGLSNVLLEAAACGRPVIASYIPGCKETFDEGVSGFGFEPRNVDSLISAVEKMLSVGEHERGQMGICGRRKVEQEFNRQIVINAYLKELYL